MIAVTVRSPPSQQKPNVCFGEGFSMWAEV